MLMLTDLLCLLVAGLLAAQFRWFSALNYSTEYEQIFILLCILLLIKFFAPALYPGLGLHYIDELRKLVTSLSLTFVILAAVTFVLHNALIFSRLVLLLTWALSVVLVPFGRYLRPPFVDLPGPVGPAGRHHRRSASGRRPGQKTKY